MEEDHPASKDSASDPLNEKPKTSSCTVDSSKETHDVPGGFENQTPTNQTAEQPPVPMEEDHSTSSSSGSDPLNENQNHQVH